MQRDGYTLLEIVVALTIVGVLAMLVTPRFAAVRDWLVVDRVAQEVASFYYQARQAATLQMMRVRIEFGADSLVATYEGRADSTFLVRRGPASRGVQLTASRSVIRIYANGIGFGAANTKIVLRRGTVTATLTTSRRGRLKRW
jgi:prepilin-type N-terminal cleavage/methylation domain-containing protein